MYCVSNETVRLVPYLAARASLYAPVAYDDPVSPLCSSLLSNTRHVCLDEAWDCFFVVLNGNVCEMMVITRGCAGGSNT